MYKIFITCLHKCVNIYSLFEYRYNTKDNINETVCSVSDLVIYCRRGIHYGVCKFILFAVIKLFGNINHREYGPVISEFFRIAIKEV